jgi:hypothetical protein
MAGDGRRLSFDVRYFQRHLHALTNSDANALSHRRQRISKQSRYRASERPSRW